MLGVIPQDFLVKVYPDAAHRQDVIERLSPNLDRLAQMGLVFNNTFCASPLCGPSRTALMTGVPPHVSGYYQHDRHFRHYESLEGVVTLPHSMTSCATHSK